MNGEPFDGLIGLDRKAAWKCNRCGRLTWSPGETAQIDQMPAPDGGICGGLIEPPTMRAPAYGSRDEDGM